MKDSQTRHLETFQRITGFAETHADSFPTNSLGNKLFAEIKSAFDDLNTHAATQAGGLRTRSQGTTTKSGTRADLREAVRAICQTAQSIAVEQPGIESRFRMPARDDQSLLSGARAIATAAEPLKAKFIEYGLPADFLEDLETKIESFVEATERQNAGKEARVSATASIDDAIERGMSALRRVDAIVRNTFRDDAAMLAAWESAKHVERARTKHEKKKTEEAHK